MGKVVAGWGMNGTWTTGTIYDDNKRRAGSNYVDPIVLWYDYMLLQDVSKRTSLEFLIGHGDSGGIIYR